MLDRSNPYFRQVALVVRVLPLAALEGGALCACRVAGNGSSRNAASRPRTRIREKSGMERERSWESGAYHICCRVPRKPLSLGRERLDMSGGSDKIKDINRFSD